MARQGGSSFLEALDTSTEKADQGYGTGCFGFEDMISDDSNESPSQSSPGNLDEHKEEDDVVLVEDTPPDGSGHIVTKRALDFKESFSKDYKIPRKCSDSEVVVTSPVLADKSVGYSSPLSKSQYPPCNTQYSPRTQNTPKVNLKLLQDKGTFNSYQEDRQAHVTSPQTNINSGVRLANTPQSGQKIRVHVPACNTVAMKPRIVVDNHGITSTSSQQTALSPNAVTHGINSGKNVPGGLGGEDSSCDVAESSLTARQVADGTVNSTTSMPSISSSVQIKLQHDQGQLSGGEVVNAVSTGGLQGGGRGLVVRGRGAAVQNRGARGGVAQGSPARRGRGRPPTLKGNAMGMNMLSLSSAHVNLGDRCDQTSSPPANTQQGRTRGFQDEFQRSLGVGRRGRRAPEGGDSMAEEMRNTLNPPSRLGTWKHAQVESTTVPSSTATTVPPTVQTNGEASQDTQQDAESSTETKEQGSSSEKTEEEDDGKVLFLCSHCGNSGYLRDRCNGCGKSALQKLASSNDPFKPQARAPIARTGIRSSKFYDKTQSANSYKDRMTRFANILSPGAPTTSVTHSKVTGDKQTQERVHLSTTRRNTRNAGRPPGRSRITQKEVEVVLISDDEEDLPKPAAQPDSSPASQSGSRANTPVPDSTQAAEADSSQGNISVQDKSDSPQVKEAPKTSAAPSRVKVFISDGKTAMINVRAVRLGSRLVKPSDGITFNMEQGIRINVEGQSFDLQPNDIVQSVAHFGAQTPFVQFSVTPKVGLAVRSRFRFKKQEGWDWFDPGSSDASEKYIILLLHTPVPKSAVDFLRLHLQAFAQQPDTGFMEVNDKDQANSILLSLEVKEPLQKNQYQESYFVTTQSVLASSKVGTSTTDHTTSAVSKGPSTVAQGQSTTARGQSRTYSCRRIAAENRMPLPDTTSRSSSPFDHDNEEDDRDGFVGPVVKLMVYPPPPATGGITVTTEDVWCLRDGEFLNDVIIDFYLKYLVNAVLSDEDRKRTHIFSSFFYKRLMQRDHVRTRSEDDMRTLPMYRRHSRVKTWTRHVDLFSKDFVIVPINEHSHWYLAVICFPGLDKEDPHPTFVPRLTRPPTPDLDPPTPDLDPPTPATDPKPPAEQSTEESESGSQQSSQKQSTADSTREQRSEDTGHDPAWPSSCQSSAGSSECQEDTNTPSSQDSSSKGIQTEPLTREQIEAAIFCQMKDEERLTSPESSRKCSETLATEPLTQEQIETAICSQIKEEERLNSPQSSRRCSETLDNVSLTPRRSPRKSAEAASSLDSSSVSSQESSPSKRNSPRKKTEETPKHDSRHSLVEGEVRNSCAMSTTSPRKKLKFLDAENEKKEDTEEKMDVDQYSGDQSEGLREGGSDNMETDQSTTERRLEEMQAEPMKTEVSASAIDTSQQGSCDQAKMDDSASDQSGATMSDQSIPAMSIRRRPCIILFDSLRGPRRQNVMKNIREYLTVEWEVRKKDQPKREFDNNNMKGAFPKVPQQTNYSDCGVFLLQYVETFFSNPIQDYSFPLHGLENWFSIQKVKRKRLELHQLIHKLTKEQEEKEKGTDTK